MDQVPREVRHRRKANSQHHLESLGFGEARRVEALQVITGCAAPFADQRPAEIGEGIESGVTAGAPLAKSLETLLRQPTLSPTVE